jgi:hypothetical protein
VNDDPDEIFRSRRYAPPQFHPTASNFPMMDPSSLEFKGLVASIRENGLWEPITMHEGMVLDGRNRLRACEEAGIEPRFEDFDDTETTALAFVLAKNLYRRHLTEGQKALKAEEMVTSKHGETERWSGRPSDSPCKPPFGDLQGPIDIIGKGQKVTREAAARLWCVSLRAVDRASFVRAHTETTPKILAEVRAPRHRHKGPTPPEPRRRPRGHGAYLPAPTPMKGTLPDSSMRPSSSFPSLALFLIYEL